MLTHRVINKKKYVIGDVNVENSGEVFYMAKQDSWYILANGKIAFADGKYQTIEDLQSQGYYNIVTGFNKETFDYVTTFKKIDGKVAYERTVCGKLVEPDVLPDYLWDSMVNKYDVNYRYKGRLSNKAPYENFDTSRYGFYGSSLDTARTYYKDKVNTQLRGKTPEKLYDYLASTFNGTTFGIEIETASGQIPGYLCEKHGFVPVKDGSISGHEYISIPFESTPDNLYNVPATFDRFKRFVTVNEYCSLHYHIGNVPRNPEFIVAFYTLVYSLQQELHQICLPYKKSAKYLAGKDNYKDHCQALLPLSTTSKRITVREKMQNIYNFFNMSNSRNYNEKELDMPSFEGFNKWDIKSRYYIINLIPLLFKGGYGTIEFRIHHGTVNEQQAFNFLLICNALVQFSIKHQDRINKCTDKYELADIIEDIYTDVKVRDVLIEYINSTKTLYSQSILRDNIFCGRYDFMSSLSSYQSDHIYTPKLVLYQSTFRPYLDEINRLPQVVKIQAPKRTESIDTVYEPYSGLKWTAAAEKAKKITIENSPLNNPFLSYEQYVKNGVITTGVENQPVQKNIDTQSEAVTTAIEELIGKIERKG